MCPIIELTGKRGLVIGIANEHSIAYGCAKAFREAGADLAVTYLNEQAELFVRPLADELRAPIVLPCDVSKPGELEAVFESITEEWGKLDFLLHSIAFAPREDLHNSLIDCTAEGFAVAMDVSCHSFIRMARLAMPLMKEGGNLQAVSYYGAEHVVGSYNLMGPVKAALEATVRTLATDLAERGVSVHALSSGPVQTRAASGIGHFDEILDHVQRATPAHKLVSIEQVGRISAFLATSAGIPMTGSTVFADHGFHIVA